MLISVQDEILARVNFGKVTQNTFWQINYLSYHMCAIHTQHPIPMQNINDLLNIKYW